MNNSNPSFDPNFEQMRLDMIAEQFPIESNINVNITFEIGGFSDEILSYNFDYESPAPDIDTENYQYFKRLLITLVEQFITLRVASHIQPINTAILCIRNQTISITWENYPVDASPTFSESFWKFLTDNNAGVFCGLVMVESISISVTTNEAYEVSVNALLTSVIGENTRITSIIYSFVDQPTSQWMEDNMYQGSIWLVKGNFECVLDDGLPYVTFMQPEYIPIPANEIESAWFFFN